MKGGSIRLRLWSAAAISIVIGLAIAGVGLRTLFERHVERRVEADLLVELSQLIGATTIAADGTLKIAPALVDPRFATPFSGAYWQVDSPTGGVPARSRSLWDVALALAGETADGAVHHREIPGPGGALLITVERTVVDANGGSFRAIVAEDHATVTDSVDHYVRELVPALVLLAVVLLGAMFVQITVGLAPLDALRAAVSDVIARRRSRLEATVPAEVQPLADEINRLLEAQEKALERARSRATDLAHGLKTPLQVLSADIRSLRAKGETELAGEIEKTAGAIRRHVERELARARAAPGLSGPRRSKVAPVANSIVSVVRRTPEGERLAFHVDASPELAAAIDEGDLSEILGNLIENAARFAATSIGVGAAKAGGSTIITVTDDGPGVADADKDAILSRGVRLDTNGHGSGLGLAIVSDIVEAYGGTLTISDAAPGLVVAISLPGG